MERSTKYYCLVAFLFLIGVSMNIISIARSKNQIDEILQRSKRDADDAFIDEALEEHNKLRARHGSPPLTLDKELCPGAEAWAKKQAEDSQKNGEITMKHGAGSDRGENMAMSTGAWTGSKVSQGWYSEIANHNWKENVFDVKTGHFTQMVWKDSKFFCIAKYTAGKFSAVVAHYKPKGNMAYKSSFAANVLPPKA